MEDFTHAEVPERPLASASTSELLAHLATDATELVKKEVALAKAELREDIKREVKAAMDLAIAAILGLVTLNVLVIAAIFGLGQWVPEWEAALIVAGIVSTIAVIVGGVGWSKRVKQPLERTQETLKEDVQWAKERLT